MEIRQSNNSLQLIGEFSLQDIDGFKQIVYELLNLHETISISLHGLLSINIAAFNALIHIKSYAQEKNKTVILEGGKTNPALKHIRIVTKTDALFNS